MKITSKIIVASLLLIALSIPLFFTAYFFVKKQMIQQAMKEKLEQSLLHIVSVKANEVNWSEPGKEVIINGKMFDIDSYCIEKGYYHFKGLFDEEETVLNRRIENNTKQTNETGNRLLVQVFQLLQSVFPENTDIPFIINNTKANQSVLICPTIISRFKTIPTPPPQVGLQ